MTEKLQFSSEGLEALKNELTSAAETLAHVANGVNVKDHVFSESAGDAADAYSDLISTLAQTATSLYNAMLTTSRYFQTVIDGFTDWDFAQAAKLPDTIDYPGFIKPADKSGKVGYTPETPTAGGTYA